MSLPQMAVASSSPRPPCLCSVTCCLDGVPASADTCWHAVQNLAASCRLCTITDRVHHVCHNNAGKISGLDLSTYESSLAGGNSGPGIIPGDPENSSVMFVQLAGGHPGQLADDEIQQLIEWISNGAPER